MPQEAVYLDNHATTRVDPRVVDAMLPWFDKEYGNAGSVGHGFGDAARETVDQARSTIGAAIGAAPEEIVFTSGATESNNLAIRGVAESRRRRGDHVVTVATEHRAVLDPIERLRRSGFETTVLAVDPQGGECPGLVTPEAVADAVTDATCLVSVMMANNEIGVIQPIREIAHVCHASGVPLHCDATQAVGKTTVDAADLGVDLMSFTAHKLHGPKGVGALFVRRRGLARRLEPLVRGGGQERGLRSGTLNLPGIVGFGRAVELCQAEQPAEGARLAGLRDRLFQGLTSASPRVSLIGPGLATTDPTGAARRLGHNLNVAVAGIDGEALMLHMPRLAVSSGAACSAADPEPSHVLRALGMSEDEARCSLRFGLGRFTSQADIDVAIEQVTAAIQRLG